MTKALPGTAFVMTSTSSNHANKMKSHCTEKVLLLNEAHLSSFIPNHFICRPLTTSVAPPKLLNASLVVRQVSQSGKPHLHRNQPKGCFLNLPLGLCPLGTPSKGFTLCKPEPMISARTPQTFTGCLVCPSINHLRALPLHPTKGVPPFG